MHLSNIYINSQFGDNIVFMFHLPHTFPVKKDSPPPAPSVIFCFSANESVI